MNEMPENAGRGPVDERGGADEVGRDFRALKSVTAHDPPSLDMTLHAARRRGAGDPREGFSMAFDFLKRRPAFATALAMIVVVVGGLAIPMSYERTVGYDVALSMNGAQVSQAQVAEIAKSLKDMLRAPGVAVEAAMDNGALTYTFKASASGDVRPAAGAFAKQLGALGYAASVETTPRKERVSSTVYAYALGRVIEIRTDGKSAAQIESEIRDRLAAAGVTNAQVSVTDRGDNHREVKITADHLMQAGDPPAAEMPELVLTKDGKPLAGGLAVRVMKKKDDAGLVSMVVNVTHDGRSFDIDIPNPDALGDAGIAATIQSRLAAEGLDVNVNVQGNDITIEKRSP